MHITSYCKISFNLFVLYCFDDDSVLQKNVLVMESLGKKASTIILQLLLLPTFVSKV